MEMAQSAKDDRGGMCGLGDVVIRLTFAQMKGQAYSSVKMCISECCENFVKIGFYLIKS